MGIRVDQQVLRFDVSVTNSESMNIRKRSEGLVGVQFNQEHWDLLLLLIIMLQDSKDRLWHVIHHHVKIDFIWLVTLSVESMTEVNHIGMEKFLHNL